MVVPPTRASVSRLALRNTLGMPQKAKATISRSSSAFATQFTAPRRIASSMGRSRLRPAELEHGRTVTVGAIFAHFEVGARHIMNLGSGLQGSKPGKVRFMAASTSHLRPLVAGNWKMNGLGAALAEARQVRDRLREVGFAAGVDAMICPPATLVASLAREAAGSRL